MQPADGPRWRALPADTQGSDALPTCLCAAAAAVAFFLTWPFVEMPFSDDWSYAFTAFRLAQTGHLTYNGWAAPTLIPQAYWGALIIHLCGFSFTALRLGTLPFAMGCAAVCYLLARRCDLKLWPAVLTSLTMVLSAVFLPLATSFMTDVPALLFTMLSLYALICCGQSSSPGSRFGWLTLGTLAGIIGGMDRQVVWLAPLAVLPYLMLVRRRSFGAPLLLAAIIAWILVALDAWITLRWFNAQPYTIPLSLGPHLLAIAHHPRRLWETAVAMWLTTGMITLPCMLLGSVAAAQNLILARKSLFVVIIFILAVASAVIFLAHFPRFAEMPWLGNMVTPFGILGAVEIIGNRPLVIPRWFGEAGGTLIWIMTIVLLVWAAVLLTRRAKENRKFRGPTGDRKFAPHAFAISCLAIFAAVYAAVVLSRSGSEEIFDRYMLALTPPLAIGLLAWWQNATMPLGLRRFAWRVALTLLGLIAAFSIASTQEVLALGRARLEALSDLQSIGVRPGDVLAGIEQIGRTLLESSGHLTRRQVEILDTAAPYEVDKTGRSRSMADYLVEASPDPRRAAVLLGKVRYFSLLPPLHREIFIYQAPPWQSWRAGRDTR